MVECAREPRSPEVGLDRDRRRIGPGDGEREVRGDRRLALAGGGACDQDRAHRPGHAEVLEIRAERAERLARRPGLMQQRTGLRRPDPRDLSDHRDAEALLDGLARPELAVEMVTEERADEPQEQPERARQDRVSLRSRRHRTRQGMRRIEDRRSQRQLRRRTGAR